MTLLTIGGDCTVWTRLYSRQWMHDHRHGRLKLSVFTVLFAIATGILTSVRACFLMACPISELIERRVYRLIPDS